MRSYPPLIKQVGTDLFKANPLTSILKISQSFSCIHERDRPPQSHPFPAADSNNYIRIRNGQRHRHLEDTRTWRLLSHYPSRSGKDSTCASAYAIYFWQQLQRNPSLVYCQLLQCFVRPICSYLCRTIQHVISRTVGGQRSYGE